MTADRSSLHDDKKRSSPRTRLFLSAEIHFDHCSEVVRLRDLSADGVRIEGANLPDIGTSAQLSRGALRAGGTVVWRDRKSCGLRFDAPLSLEAWGAKTAPSKRIPGIGETPEAIGSTVSATALNDTLPKRLAEELAYVSRLLESLGDELSSEPLIVLRHGQSLQDIDLSMQILGHVAALLVAEQPEEAVETIAMVSLRKRLKRVAL